jgi:hypothetical protein
MLLVFAKTKDVDYLLIAKPAAFNQLGIHHDCAVRVSLHDLVSCW